MILFDLPAWLMLPYLFVLGLVLGSFLNVCIYRLPRYVEVGRAWFYLSHPPSRCPRCLARIRWRDNLPIVSWFLLRGRCRQCLKKISPRYPAVELLNGVLFVLLYLANVPLERFATLSDSYLASTYGVQTVAVSWLSDQALVNIRFLYHVCLVEMLVVATFIDFDLRIIPDSVTVPGMVVGVGGATLFGQLYLVPLWFQSPELSSDTSLFLPASIAEMFNWPTTIGWALERPHWHGLLVSLAGFVVGGGIVWLVRIIGFWTLRREAMGFGDVILMAAIGSYIGWQPVLVVFFLAPGIALLAVALQWMWRRGEEIPYGPYLSLATLAVILGWEEIWPRAERLFELGPLLVPIALIFGLLFVVTLTALQFVKRLLGWQEEYDELGEWTAADQNQYLAGERVDQDQGSWRRRDWEGRIASRGQLFEQRWRGR